jgi:mono/diheme cytochrome c family protein
MVKKILKITVIVLAAAFVIIQFIRPSVTNPPENQPDTLEASTSVPSDVEAIFTRSCADCHSNRTIYPWYSYVAPTSWLLADDINGGRRELNLSTWNMGDTKRKVRKLDKICEEVQDGEMPLRQYLWIHWNAKPTPNEVKTLCAWTDSEKQRLQPE